MWSHKAHSQCKDATCGVDRCKSLSIEGELESESSVTTTADEKMREVQAAAKQQQALAFRLIKAGELMHICRPLAYVLALRR